MLPLEEAKQALVELEELTHFIAKFGALPIPASFNLEKIVEVASKGGVLSPIELDHIASDVLSSKKLYDFFNSYPPRYTYRYTMKQAIENGILCG